MSAQGKAVLRALQKADVTPDQPFDHTIYVLVQEDFNLFDTSGRGRRTFYTGCTTNFKRRLIQHNTGKTKATKGIQWKLFKRIEGFTKQQAYILEKYLKRGDTKTKRQLFADWSDAITEGKKKPQEYWNAIEPALRFYGMFSTERRPEKLNTGSEEE